MKRRLYQFLIYGMLPVLPAVVFPHVNGAQQSEVPAEMMQKLEQTQAASKPTVAEAEPQTVPIPVEVEQGRSTSVVLRSNPSTGFSWCLAEALPERSPVEVTIRLGSAEPSSTPLCGAPCHTIVEFKGIRPGAQVVRLLYRRPWEPAHRYADEAVFEVSVRK